MKAVQEFSKPFDESQKHNTTYFNECLASLLLLYLQFCSDAGQVDLTRKVVYWLIGMESEVGHETGEFNVQAWKIVAQVNIRALPGEIWVNV